MMTTLKLRLDVDHLIPGQFTSLNEVLVNIYPLSKTAFSSDRRRQLQNLIIPVGPSTVPDPSFASEDLEPGRYYIEAVLPSEEIVSQEIEILAEQNVLELRLKTKGSTHEWLAWQRFSGNVASPTSYVQQTARKDSFAMPTIDARLVMTASPITTQIPISEIDIDTIRLSQGMFFANPNVQASLSDKNLPGLDGWVPWQAFTQPCISSNLLIYDFADNISILYKFNYDYISRSVKDVPAFENYKTWTNRFYLFINGPDVVPQYCVIPVPWRITYTEDDAEVQVLVQQLDNQPANVNSSDQGFRISVVVEDNTIASLIAYLGTGQIPAAKVLLKKSEEALFWKTENPMAAAAGAYVLVGTADSDRPENWHAWIENLMNFFPWLPDGAILYGRELLRIAKNEGERLEARKCYLEGFRRGVPIYSKGVVYLLEGLTRFANDESNRGMADPELLGALKETRNLALRTNVNQPFTTVLMD